MSVVVHDLTVATAFFAALGMTITGRALAEGPWVDRVNGMAGVQVDIVMMQTPDGHGRLELTTFRHPPLVETQPVAAPPNTLGLRNVMFAVESVDDTVTGLRAHGADLIGEVVEYKDVAGCVTRAALPASLSCWLKISALSPEAVKSVHV
ncbi:VOC family protein [Deinococcus hohokamensis]|uniref:VOC family protein n=1 Tax=Deinococcus hohokamensis TaxID=309883 RepID=A0ABV9ID10_9DEIO